MQRGNAKREIQHGAARVSFVFVVVVVVVAHRHIVGTCFFSYIADEQCGEDFGSCISDDFPPTIIVVIIIASICFSVGCITCFIQSKKRQQSSSIDNAHVNRHAMPHSCELHEWHDPTHVFYARSSYGHGTDTSWPDLYEEPPPSYNMATANVPTGSQPQAL